MKVVEVESSYLNLTFACGKKLVILIIWCFVLFRYVKGRFIDVDFENSQDVIDILEIFIQSVTFNINVGVVNLVVINLFEDENLAIVFVVVVHYNYQNSNDTEAVEVINVGTRN